MKIVFIDLSLVVIVLVLLESPLGLLLFTMVCAIFWRTLRLMVTPDVSFLDIRTYKN